MATAVRWISACWDEGLLAGPGRQESNTRKLSRPRQHANAVAARAAAGASGHYGAQLRAAAPTTGAAAHGSARQRPRPAQRRMAPRGSTRDRCSGAWLRAAAPATGAAAHGSARPHLQPVQPCARAAQPAHGRVHMQHAACIPLPNLQPPMSDTPASTSHYLFENRALNAPRTNPPTPH